MEEFQLLILRSTAFPLPQMFPRKVLLEKKDFKVTFYRASHSHQAPHPWAPTSPTEELHWNPLVYSLLHTFQIHQTEVVCSSGFWWRWPSNSNAWSVLPYRMRPEFITVSSFFSSPDFSMHRSAHPSSQCGFIGFSEIRAPGYQFSVSYSPQYTPDLLSIHFSCQANCPFPLLSSEHKLPRVNSRLPVLSCSGNLLNSKT